MASNPECELCGEKLTFHRLDNKGQVRCLRMQPTKKELEAGIEPRPISGLDPLWNDEEAQRKRLMRMPMSRLVPSPLSHTPAALEWVEALFPVTKTSVSTPDEMFPEVM